MCVCVCVCVCVWWGGGGGGGGGGKFTVMFDNTPMGNDDYATPPGLGSSPHPATGSMQVMQCIGP